MQAPIADHAAPKGLLHLRRLRPTIETAVVLAAIVTALACYFRGPLTHRELSFVPGHDGTIYQSYDYGDEGSGGTSVASPVAGRQLAWTCNLTTAYQYRYCGFGLLLDPGHSGRGIDLRGIEKVRITFRYDGPAHSLRAILKDKDASYIALGAPSDEKPNMVALPASPGAQTAEARLDQFKVAEWWSKAETPPAELLGPDFDNVTTVEFLTAADAAPGMHRLSIDKIEFEGTAVSAEAWYAAIAGMWFLIIGSLLFQRRRETAQWRTQVLETMRQTVETIPHMVWSLDRDGTVYFNRRWEDFIGIPTRAGGRLFLGRLIHSDDLRSASEAWAQCVSDRCEFDAQIRIRHRSGDYRWVLARAVPSFGEDGAIVGWYGTCTDVHDRVLAQQALRRSISSEREKSQQLKWASEHDALTGLPNRRAFEARLADTTGSTQASAAGVGLLLIDIDYFKHLNDTLGHNAGDEFLRAVATRVRQSLRQEDFVARIGGDEFAVILPGLQAESELIELGNRVVAAIQLPIEIVGRVVRPGASIGGAAFPGDAASADDLLKRADAALYALKRAGRGGFRLFQRYMLDDVERIAGQLTRAREAIAEEALLALYQPKVAFQGGGLVGFEALLRYSTSDGVLEPPHVIEEAFKDYELAAKIGELMQHRVARDIERWIKAGVPFGRVSINAAPAEFLRDDYAERLLRILDRYRVPSHCVEIEVTEHAFFERGPELAARALETLKSAGVAISLDDFGTGYSSLSHMRDFPVDLIKIDRSYTKRVADDAETAALVAGVIHLARSLDLQVVAEGVETERQFALLREMGCHFAQGHLVGLPIASDEVDGFAANCAAIRSAA
jgi:diguanylate cyclase (GGDEF)-like protein/PAS domain S-box-containing protein